MNPRPTLAFALLLTFPCLLAQGPLTPPAGPPAPGMKSLDQVEARTPLIAGSPGVEIFSDGGIYITAPGSYYLTKNLRVTAYNGIVITASGVTLDLNGYTISSSSASNGGTGIEIADDITRVSISNGHIVGGTTYNGSAFVHGPGLDSGIAGDCSLVRVTNVSVSGMRYEGIQLEGGTPERSDLVQACTVRTVAGVGIEAGVVTDCSVTQGGPQTIIATRVANSVGARADGSGTGITTTGTTLEVLGAAADKRTPIPVSGPFPYNITASGGSYYLTGSISVTTGSAFVITGKNVTLDLNGFTIASTSPSRSGFAVHVDSGGGNTSIRNGFIRGTTLQDGSGGGFSGGIFGSASGEMISVRDVRVHNTGFGINGNQSRTTIENCSVNTCNTLGIKGTIIRNCYVTNVQEDAIAAQVATGCVAFSLGNVGIRGETVENCQGNGFTGIWGSSVSNSSGSGVNTGLRGSVISNSQGFASAASGVGIFGTSISNCYGNAAGGDAIRTSDQGVATNCFGVTVADGIGVGLRAFTANGSRGQNHNGAISQVITNKYNMP